jgi:hypothetical protein
LTRQDRVLAMVGAAIIGAGFWGCCVSILRGLRSRSWSSVVGEIIESNLDLVRGARGSKLYAPSVRYAYRVQGRNYESERVFFGFADFYTKRGAVSVVEAYPIGQQVDVYYDPSDPSCAVLRRGITGRTLVAAGFLGVVFLIVLGSTIGLF